MKKNQVKVLKQELKTLKAVIKKVKEQKDLLEDIISMMPGHIYWLDRSNKYLGCNKLQAKNSGLKSRKDLIGKTNFEIHPKKQAVALNNTNDLVMKTGKAIDIEEPATFFGNGSPRSYLTQKTPLRDRKGNIVGVLGVSFDITDRKNAEKLQKEKEIANHVIMLADSIANEINVPLTITNINLDLLKLSRSTILSKSTDQKIREALLTEPMVTIKNATKSASCVVNNLLVTLRALVNNSQINKNTYKPMLIQNSIASAIDDYPFINNGKSLIKWDKAVNFKYLGDDTLTQHVFFNLIKDSLSTIKENGSGEITIRQEIGKDFNKVIFINSAAKFKKNNFAKTLSNTNLGLAFCKMLMKSYNGDIACELKKDGTYFELLFPKT